MNVPLECLNIAQFKLPNKLGTGLSTANLEFVPLLSLLKQFEMKGLKQN